MSVPNQKIVTVHASKEVPFLKVGIEEWQKAYDNLRWADDKAIREKKKSEPRVSTLALYLYLAGNAEDFKLELSQKAVENALGISKTSYHRAIHELTILGYIYEDSNGCLNFAPSPKVGIRTQIQDWESDESKVKQDSPNDETPSSQFRNKGDSALDREINNKDNINTINKTYKGPSDPYSQLKMAFKPNGYFEYKGFDRAIHKGYFDSHICGFWKMTDQDKKEEIMSFFPLSNDEAEYIVNNILDETTVKHWDPLT